MFEACLSADTFHLVVCPLRIGVMNGDVITEQDNVKMDLLELLYRVYTSCYRGTSVRMTGARMLLAHCF